MCGIIGILSGRSVVERIYTGLKKLEYRGYDSAGIAVLKDGEILRRRAVGKLAELGKLLDECPVDGFAGIGHTRWATHGQPTVHNAHPHATERVALVHNGIIENFAELRAELASDDIYPKGQSDTEVITLVLDKLLASGLAPIDAFHALLKRLDGAFALGVIIKGANDLMLAARRGSPLVIGLGEGENFLGSDAIALSSLTADMIYLEEGDSAAITRSEVHVFDNHYNEVQRPIKHVSLEMAVVDKGNHRHFMHKEMHEQPTVLAQTLGRYVDYSQSMVTLPDLPFQLADIRRVTLVACGTSFYAANVARYWVEQIAGVPAEVDIASEFRYRKPVMDPDGLTIFISQSGETADTLAALKLAKEKGQKILSIVNVDESSMARESDALIRTYAGPEIGVASTKAFTCQLGALASFVLGMARSKEAISQDELAAYIADLAQLPTKMNEILQNEQQFVEIARSISTARDALFVARGVHYPIAMEGALKLKEISYIHAEGYAAGELKHGPIALVDENMPVIGLAPSHELYEKTVSNLQEIQSRKGQIILITDHDKIDDAAMHLKMPQAGLLTSPILYSLPVQLLSYHTAVAKGTDVDQPRNLAKSVTVE